MNLSFPLPAGIYPAINNTNEVTRFYIDGCATVLKYVVQKEGQISLQLNSPEAENPAVIALFSALHQALPAEFQLRRDVGLLAVTAVVPTDRISAVLADLITTTLGPLRRTLALPEPQVWPTPGNTHFFPPHLIRQEAELLQALQAAAPETLLGPDNAHWQQQHAQWWNLRQLRTLTTPKQAVDFSAIYQAGGWANPHNDGTVSGDGSAMVNTQVVRGVLDKLIPVLGLTSLLDVPCGDFHWMRAVRLGDIRYVGGDCVTELVASNQEKYGRENREFRVVDLRGDPLERFDLVLTRDLFIHLSFDEIFAVLANIRLSRSRYLAASTYFHVTNRETPIDFHPINLMRPPFNFPDPLFSFFEQIANSPTRCIGIWELDALPPLYDRIAA